MRIERRTQTRSCKCIRVYMYQLNIPPHMFQQQIVRFYLPNLYFSQARAQPCAQTSTKAKPLHLQRRPCSDVGHGSGKCSAMHAAKKG
jgi:hypothetical protein